MADNPDCRRSWVSTTSGCLLKRKYTPSRWMVSSMAANNNASIRCIGVVEELDAVIISSTIFITSSRLYFSHAICNAVLPVTAPARFLNSKDIPILLGKYRFPNSNTVRKFARDLEDLATISSGVLSYTLLSCNEDAGFHSAKNVILWSET